MNSIKKPKLTPPFPGTVKPCSDAEHIGVYRRLIGSWRYARWGGRLWYWSAKTIDEAIAELDVAPDQNNPPWRGLAEKP